MKTLVVAEKPSVGRDIARVLGAKNKGEGCLTSADYIVTWAIGHLITLSEPGEIDERYKKWRMDELPMLPEKIPLKVIYNTRSQFQIVKKLMNDDEVGEIVCATDSGREGELIFRYIYKMANCRKSVKRLWISSMTDASIRAGFQNMLPGTAYDALYLSAKCRSEADWLVGMNASRAFSLKYNAHLSIGRVQTPTLALIVKRDQEIRAFTPEDYYELHANFGDYKGTWIDEKTQKTRIESEQKAREIEALVKGKTGVVVESTKEEKRTAPPKLYDLTTLQREANRKFGFSADKTLSVAQALYERHKLITYPRTDSSYLTNDMEKKVEGTLNALPSPYKEYVSAIAPVQKAKRIYNEKKVSDHHAIIPTEKKYSPDSLTADERNIYDLVARRLIAAHYPDYIYMAAKIITEAEGQKFKSLGNVTINEGWRKLYQSDKDKEEDIYEQALPDVKKGDTRKVVRTSVKKQTTRPPKEYTDDTLLKAMEDAGKMIEDEELREEMKDAGLGTPATRAQMITRLIEVGYVKRNGKKLLSTEKGQMLIQVVPEEIKSADTTGKWERALSRMSAITDESIMPFKEKRFMDSIRRFSAYLVDSAKASTVRVMFPKEAEIKKKKKASPKAGGGKAGNK